MMPRWIIGLSVLFASIQSVHAEPEFHGYEREVGRTERPTRATRRRLEWFRETQDKPLAVSRIETEFKALAARHPDRMKLSVIGGVNTRTGRTTLTHPLYRIDLKSAAKTERQQPQAQLGRKLKVLVASGVHGNEPVGVETALLLTERALRKSGLLQRFDITILPMVNPTGLASFTRNNHEDHNINREFMKGSTTPESRALMRALHKETFDLFIDLHGSWHEGFFLIRGSNDGDMSQRILSAMESHALLDGDRSPHGAITNQVGPYQLHALGGATSENEGTFKDYMKRRGVPYSYTFEAPRRLAPKKQVQGLFKLLRSALDNVYRHGEFSHP